MPDRYKNKYRIPSARLRNWDYGGCASYFITICSQNRECYFGEIIDCKMRLSEIGKIVENEWLKTFELRPDMNLINDEFVIMPNHFHAIIIIGENEYNTNCKTNGRDVMHRVSTGNDETNKPQNKFGPQSKNLASIVRGFKSAVTIHARKIQPDFAWQSRFHDHIIRNEKEYQKIKVYVLENPLSWKDDKHNLE